MRMITKTAKANKIDKSTPISKRLLIIFKEFGGSQEAFGHLCETSRPHIWRQLYGETEITVKTIINVCHKLGYSATWLIFGTGSKKSDGSDSKLVTEISMLRTEIDVMKNLYKALLARMNAYDGEISRTVTRTKND